VHNKLKRVVDAYS